MADLVAALKRYIRESDETVGRGASFAEGLFYFEISAIRSSGGEMSLGPFKIHFRTYLIYKISPNTLAIFLFMVISCLKNEWKWGSL